MSFRTEKKNEGCSDFSIAFFNSSFKKKKTKKTKKKKLQKKILPV